MDRTFNPDSRGAQRISQRELHEKSATAQRRVPGTPILLTLEQSFHRFAPLTSALGFRNSGLMMSWPARECGGALPPHPTLSLGEREFDSSGAHKFGRRWNFRRLPLPLPLLGERAGVRESGATGCQPSPGLAQATLASPSAGNGHRFQAEDVSDLGLRIHFGTRNSNFGFQVESRF